MTSKTTNILKVTLIGCALCAANLAQADAPAPAAAPTPNNVFTANVALYSQYIFRGLTQTDRRPALQGGFDYAHSSGFYAGVWGSNISWISDFNPGTSASLEADTYLGFKHSFINDDWTYDVGFLRYNYPGNYTAHVPTPTGGIFSYTVTKADTNELYGALSWKWVTLKFSDSLGDTFGVCSASGTYYADLTAAVPLPSDLTLTLHGGKQEYKGTCNGARNSDLSYTDWRAELAWAFAKDWTAGAGYTDTNARKDLYTPIATNRFIGDGQAYVFVKKTF
jgi:uncharacterized protein (TIGR02001 family)